MKKIKTEQTSQQGIMSEASARPVKRKKKRKKAPVIIAALVILVVVWRLASCALSGTATAVVTTTVPVRGDLQESISTSGVVESEVKKQYFAPVSGILGAVNAAAGDAVKKGDLLVSYDEEQLERSLKQASLQLTMNTSTYQSAMKDSAESSGRLREANTNLAVLNQQISDYEAYLESLQEKLEQNQRDTSTGLAEESYNLSARAASLEQEMKSLSPDSPEYAEKYRQLQEVTTAQSRNGYLQQIASSSSSDYAVKMQKEINDVTRRLNECKEYKAEMETQKNTSENTVLDSYQKQKYEADREMANMTYQQAEEDYYTARQGLSAEFDGIVTECSAVEGATVTEGLKLLTLAASNEVKVSFSASKYDLEKLETGQKAQITTSGNIYEGEISKINRMAAVNASNTPMVGVEIHVTNPDDKIILGLDAKIQIFTHKAENALLVPVEAINADKEGDFLYVVENGVVVRKPVVCGISSDTHTQIKEGIDENAQIIVASYTTLEEGMPVATVPDTGLINAADGNGMSISAGVNTQG